MKRHEPDIVLTLALCLSLVAHAGLFLGAIYLRVKDLQSELYTPASPLAYQPGPAGNLADSTDDWAASPIIRPAPALPPDLAAVLPPPEPNKPHAKPRPRPEDFVNSEWGEKDAKGIALNSAPGKEPLQARKAEEDQAFASRDPEGPGPIPDEPSQSLMRPGEGGDGRKPVRDALAGKGTEGSPMIVFGNPDAPTIPPAPERNSSARRSDQTGAGVSDSTGEARSILPSDPRSPATPALGTSPDEGPGGLVASAIPEQMLPIARADVIGIRSGDDWWPTTVDALIRPPGMKSADGTPQLLPDLAPDEVPTSPSIQPATVAMIAPARMPEDLALRVGESQPDATPTIVDALTSPPGESASNGARQPLADLVPADAPGGEAVQDAIAQLLAPPTVPEEMAQPLDKPGDAAIVVVPKGPMGSAGSATGGIPGPPVPAADPAADLGLETDPFNTIPSVVFRNGQIEARNGRQVKPLRPRLTEAGRRDIIALQFPTVLLKVRIDASGKVTDVKIVHSSGSDAIDMPVYRSLWGWWFEPPKDKKGNPLPDVQLVAIHWV